jgi:superfamily II DNA or RNA helicase
MDELLAAIRKACSATTWSRGVELARANAVVIQAETAKDVELQVATKGGLVAPLVTLFLDDNDWSCECNSSEDACAHVAAAAIALQQARKDGKPLPSAGGKPGDTTGRIAYRFQLKEGGIALLRTIVHAGGEHIIDGSIAAVAMGKVKGPKFVAAEGDLRFEKKLGTFIGGVLPRHQVAKVFEALSGVGEITLDGTKVEIGAPSPGLCVRVRGGDEGGWFAQLERDPSVDEIHKNGIVQRSGRLHPLGGHGLGEAEYGELRRGKWFDTGDLGTLVGDMIPRWRRTLSVVLDAELPDPRVLKPRIRLVSERDGDGLAVLPTIVYGDPAVARVDGEKLTLLGGNEVPLRNPRLERMLADRLRDLGLESGVRRAFATDEAIVFASRIGDADDVAKSDNVHRDFVTRGDLDVFLDVEDDGGFDLAFVGHGDKRSSMRADPAAVMRAWARGDRFAPLLDGGFGRIPQAWLAQHGERVAALLRAKSAGKDDALPRWALGDLAALCTALEQPAPPAYDRWRALFEDFAGIPEPRLPADLRAELRHYQHEGVAWLTFLRDAELGGLLADDMGLGKTLQTLCVITGRTLVVAPTSVLPNWQAEIAKFRPALTADVYHGSGRALDPEADVTLTTYALLRLDREVLSAVEWDTIVLDEAQTVKNPDSQVARAAFGLRGRFRLALTGTPVENRLDDLWSQFHFVSPGLLGGRSDFEERFAKPIDAGSADAAKALRDRIKPFVLRRLKRDVAKELPPRTDVVLHCELRDDERRVYDAVRAATQRAVAEKLGAGEDVLAVLEALLRLRQAACHTALVPGQTATERPSSKVELLLETLDESLAGGHKSLVFSQWTSLLDLVQHQLRERSIDHLRLDGSTRDRGDVVARFQDASGPGVMLVSLRAGGTGLNLTAADHVILMDPWWNPAVEDQAADRAHRIGQDKPVLVHRMVARGTVEEGILALQGRKRALAEAAVADGAGATKITKDELLALIQ